MEANQDLPWLRWWDSEGNLLLSGDERGDQEKQRGDQEKKRADDQQQRADRLAAKLQALGIEAD